MSSYVKGSYRKKRFTAFRRYKKNAGRYKKAMSLATQVYKLKGLVNSEMLHYDRVTTAANIDNIGVVENLTAITQGDTVAGRTGNSVFVRAVNIKGYITRNSAGDSNQSVRLVVLIDTQQVGDTAPVWTDVYNTQTIQTHLNIATVGRFKILYNRVFHMASGVCDRVNLNINLPMRHHVRYNGVNSSDIQKGGIYLMYLSTQNAANYPTLNCESRTNYHDN